ncbi:MAG: hypothetical protein BGO21_07390 [Dyadobacter sp. 50-39]|uniref:PAS domain S-box protein n=1 Tax=Dyadobacter sp. 50-39 TaxID=1895756 RepID=UPI0009682FA8|nr:PAS domain S-box protein [Dyadobacter sp. 50-39]OJV17197.1 MAG: hypothetical protein BGO21_07390 [Dyadobacter sp. 50-39]
MQIKALLKDDGVSKLLACGFEVVSLLNPALEIVYRSPNAARVTGWSDQVRLGRHISEVIHPDDAETVMQTLYEVLGCAGLVKSSLFRIDAPAGDFIWIQASFTNMLEDLAIQAIVCHFLDVSHKKSSSLLLEQTNSELFAYKYALDESAIVAITDQKGIIKKVNENFCRISGYSADELIGQDHRILNSAYHEKEYIRNLWTTIANGLVWKGELRNRAKDGSYYWVDTTIVPFLNDKGKPYQYLAIRADITSRKLGEEKLAEEQRHLKLLESVVTNTKDAILITEAEPQDEPGPRIIYVNDAFTRMTGYRAAEVVGKTPRLLQGPKTDRRELDRLKESLLKWESCETTIVNYKKNGEEFWINLVVTPVADDNGLYTHWISVERDITESRKMEDLLDKVTTLAGIGAWVVDMETSKIFWSPITRKIHEVEDDFEPDMESGLDFYQEADDRERVRIQISRATNTGQPFDFEARILTAKQNVRWVRAIGEPEFERGKCVRIRGSFQDIDVRKRAELAAQEASEERNAILESIGDAFFAADKNWTVTYWNNVAEAVFGKKKREVKGQNFWVVFPESIGLGYDHYYQLAIETNQPVHFEYFYQPLEKWYDISAYPSVNGISVYLKDVTERKRVTSALEVSERNYSSLFQSSPLPMWVFDMQTLRFLDVNEAAIHHYGYRKEEFLKMTIRDIRPADDLIDLEKALSGNDQAHQAVKKGVFRHQKKNGDIIQVDIQSNLIQYKGRPATVIVANDMTERFAYVRAIEEQNAKLKDIAFMQSHVVRAPLARIMGIVRMLQNWEMFADEREQLLAFLQIAANELDDVVKEISDRTAP